MTNFWTFIGVAATVATAMPWDGASPTEPAVENLGWTPMPTEAPFPLFGGEMVPLPGKHIFARAFSDRLCGSVNGDPERPWTCDYSLATCTTGSGVLGCCYPDADSTICGFRTTCIGAVAQSSCGVSCLSNTLMRKCTDSAAPHCILYTASNGVSVWGCTTSASLTESIQINAAITIEKSTSIDVVSRTTFVAPSSASTSNPATATSDGATANDETTTGGGGGSKSNVGAIAGGVVGGLAVIVLGGLALFFIMSRRKKKAAALAAAGGTQPAYQPGMPPTQQPMLQQQPMGPPMQQPMHSGGYTDQQWNNQVYAAPPPQMHQQPSYENKMYPGSDISTPPQYGSPPPQQGQYYQPQQQHGYPAQPAAPPPTELPDRY